MSNRLYSSLTFKMFISVAEKLHVSHAHREENVSFVDVHQFVKWDDQVMTFNCQFISIRLFLEMSNSDLKLKNRATSSNVPLFREINLTNPLKVSGLMISVSLDQWEEERFKNFSFTSQVKANLVRVTGLKLFHQVKRRIMHRSSFTSRWRERKLITILHAACVVNKGQRMKQLIREWCRKHISPLAILKKKNVVKFLIYFKRMCIFYLSLSLFFLFSLQINLPRLSLSPHFVALGIVSINNNERW